jgi:hypothetical protein
MSNSSSSAGTRGTARTLGSLPEDLTVNDHSRVLFHQTRGKQNDHGSTSGSTCTSRMSPPTSFSKPRGKGGVFTH